MSYRSLLLSVTLLFLSIQTSAQVVQPRYTTEILKPGQRTMRIEALRFATKSEFAPESFNRELYSGLGTINGGEFYELAAYLQYEYGLFEKTTLFTRVGMREFETRFVDNSIRPGTQGLPKRDSVKIYTLGFDDIWVYARQKLNGGELFSNYLRYNLVGMLGVKIPTGDLLSRIPIGTGVVDYDAKLISRFDFKLGTVPSFVFVELGYRLRGGSYKNQQIYRVEYSVAAAPEVSLRASLLGVFSSQPYVYPIGIRENGFGSSTSISITAVGDERYGQASAGLEAYFTPTISVSIDVISRLFGTQTFGGTTAYLTFNFR